MAANIFHFFETTVCAISFSSKRECPLTTLLERILANSLATYGER